MFKHLWNTTYFLLDKYYISMIKCIKKYIKYDHGFLYTKISIGFYTIFFKSIFDFSKINFGLLPSLWRAHLK